MKMEFFLRNTFTITTVRANVLPFWISVVSSKSASKDKEDEIEIASKHLLIFIVFIVFCGDSFQRTCD